VHNDIVHLSGSHTLSLMPSTLVREWCCAGVDVLVTLSMFKLFAGALSRAYVPCHHCSLRCTSEGSEHHKRNDNHTCCTSNARLARLIVSISYASELGTVADGSCDSVPGRWWCDAVTDTNNGDSVVGEPVSECRDRSEQLIGYRGRRVIGCCCVVRSIMPVPLILHY